MNTNKKRCGACLTESRIDVMVRFFLVALAVGVVGFLTLFAVSAGRFLIEAKDIITEAGWAGLAEMPS